MRPERGKFNREVLLPASGRVGNKVVVPLVTESLHFSDQALHFSYDRESAPYSRGRENPCKEYNGERPANTEKGLLDTQQPIAKNHERGCCSCIIIRTFEPVP